MPTDPSKVGKDLGDRFHLVNVLPATTLALFVGGTVASGAYTRPPSLGLLGDSISSVGVREAAVLAFAVVLLSLILALIHRLGTA